MLAAVGKIVESAFLCQYIPKLLNEFTISYQQDYSCIEYFLHSKEKNKQISKNLIVSHELFSHSLYVSRFYPELYKESGCRYLSAACFYMVAHHAIGLFDLKDNCCVNLEAETIIFNDFYSKLKEFDFKICYNRPCDRAYVRGHYHALGISTDMVLPHLF
ncbi:MAG: hypothetical protein ABIJ31_15680 [Pseudomonadota bacterium]